MKFYLCNLISEWLEIFMCMWRVIVLSIFLMISIQDLFSFGMVLIFKTYITNIMTYLMKYMLFQEQHGRKSSLWDDGGTKVTPFCMRSKGMRRLRGKSLASVWQGGKKCIKKYDVQLNCTSCCNKAVCHVGRGVSFWILSGMILVLGFQCTARCSYLEKD